MKNKSEIIAKFKTRNQKENKDWETYNDKLNTVLFDNERSGISRKDLITLEEGEYPLLECGLSNDNYFLMTTNRIYSFFRHYLQKRTYEVIEGFHPSTYFFRHPSLKNKTELYVIQCKNKSLFFLRDR
ncbi:MAG: hypothetical protein HC880_09425 [Bacteroidia bacterium]|nr:hypothetical protein [Bacteroidia bacterium]